jgi:hypothetical protein
VANGSDFQALALHGLPEKNHGRRLIGLTLLDAALVAKSVGSVSPDKYETLVIIRLDIGDLG